jgi:2-polyprenyl-3-methyl-5-hydroxy-6-metoxy-1,4-benzoquinol methylase
MDEINNFIKNKIKIHEIYKGINNKNLRLAKWYFENAISDAQYNLTRIKPYLKKNKKILEVGGGLNILSAYLHKSNYKIKSIEPGGFNPTWDKLKENLRKKLNLKNIIISEQIEKYSNNNLKYDFVFSINTLEHCNDIKEFINACKKVLNKNGLLNLRCPNYNFPFEGHFYIFTLPNLHKFTIEKILKKKLIKKYGEKRYNNILQNLNFDCKYTFIKKNFPDAQFKEVLEEIFNRFKNDKKFNLRIKQNIIIKISYNIIKKLNIVNFLIKFFPLKYSPYLNIFFKIK